MEKEKSIKNVLLRKIILTMTVAVLLVAGINMNI